MNIIIESAIKLDKDQQSEIEKTLKASAADVTYSVNPEILGGLRVTMGGKRIDLSLAGKVNQISNNIN